MSSTKSPLLLVFDGRGIYCPVGDFYIDPWRKVERAVVTHAHSDHARPGMGHYWVCQDNVPLMQHRLGGKIGITGVPYGQTFFLNGVKLSFHPAGHIPGSAQVRVEYKGEVWVAAGDYKVEADGLTPAFEPVQCHTFITESTFGLPIYRWKPQAMIAEQLNSWWAHNQAEGRTSILAGYSLGKIQRLLQLLNPDIGPIYTHGTVAATNRVMEDNGWRLHPTLPVSQVKDKEDLRRGLVLCPPAALGSAWMKKLEPLETGMASGWNALRGIRRRAGMDKGFILSDHADWPSLLTAIAATQAERVFVTHGSTEILARFLNEQGLEAYPAKTEFEGESMNQKADDETPDLDLTEGNTLDLSQTNIIDDHLTAEEPSLSQTTALV
jgi:putative mRNA 3-end processing factor